MTNTLPNPPRLFSDETVPMIQRYLSWQALSYELMCGVVARGIPLAPTRQRRRELMHQTRTEQSMASELVRQVEELGGAVPEHDADLDALQTRLVPLCDRSWEDYLACGQLALRAYIGPFLALQTRAEQVETDQERIAPRLIAPDVTEHFDRARRDVMEMMAELPQGERKAFIDRLERSERDAYTIFLEMLSTSYPVLHDMGLETDGLEEAIASRRDHFWAGLRAAAA